MVKRTTQVTVYPHTSLLNLAFYHREHIKAKLERGDRAGIALDSASCVVTLAFTVEGILNVVGCKLVAAWKERQPYDAKLKQCCGVLGVLDMDSEPFTTLGLLKAFRDEIAHPKPIVEKVIEISKPSDVFKHMSAPWESACNPTFALHAFEQVDAFEKLVLQHPEIGEVTFMTQAGNIAGYWE